jgi:hypothetical protein
MVKVRSLRHQESTGHQSPLRSENNSRKPKSKSFKADFPKKKIESY